MSNQRQFFSRRELLEMVLGAGGLAVLSSSVFAQQTKRMRTPMVELGPYYPVLRPKDLDADLTLIKGNKARASGEVIYISGQVLNEKGEAISGAKIEIWQANMHGRYIHPSDKNPAPLDENFQGCAVLKTDSLGRYHFKTIKPGPYPTSSGGMRTPHIHFDVTGKNNRITTQMFFPDEPLNDNDEVLKEVTRKKAVITQKATMTKEMEAGATLFNWDIVLRDG